MRALNLAFALVLAFLITVIIPGVPGEEESCYAGEDGVSICEESLDDEERSMWENPEEEEKAKKAKEETQRIFKEIDVNANGELSREEFKKHMTSRTAALKMEVPNDAQISNLFENLDKDGSGSLSFGELVYTQKGEIKR